jgi:hypothetical protein
MMNVDNLLLETFAWDAPKVDIPTSFARHGSEIHSFNSVNLSGRVRTAEIRLSEREPSGGVHVRGHMACTCNEVKIWGGKNKRHCCGFNVWLMNDLRIPAKGLMHCISCIGASNFT